MRVYKHGCDVSDLGIFLRDPFFKGNRELFRENQPSPKHLVGWENYRKLRKSDTDRRICIIASNSAKPPFV